MKRSLFVIAAVILLIGTLTAQPNEFELLGQGQFSGKLGSYVSGDTIFCVYNTATLASGTGSVILKASYDGGETWQSHTVAETVTGVGSPTVSWSPGELIVCYVSGFERYIARSSNGGQNWQTASFGRSFESSPYVEKIDGEYHTFSLDLPYPQWDQDRYLLSPESQSLRMPQYLTDMEEYPSSETSTFNGYDVLHGGVRTNNDLWIRQMGGGENNGWPTFWGPVICGGTVRVYPDGGTNYPAVEIFRGGLIEHAPRLDPPLPNRRDAIIIGPAYYDPNQIVLIEVDGSTYHGKLGTITPPIAQSANVYDIYPASPLGEPLYTNVYTEADTVWALLGSGTCNNKMFFSHGPLWIKGNFSGHQSWQSGADIYIIGDITLSGTQPGLDPADNLNDSVSLLSEKNVIVKYGYRDPEDSLRYHLARSDDDPIYIYADISAAGLSPNLGMFTYEYQQPHPSVPSVNHLGQFWDQIDLHRRPYPQTAAQPWPANIDYPWYNPLWPEAKPYLERGKLQIWGSVMQRRRGFLHRSLSDINNPTGIWNPAQNLFGGSSSPTFTNHLDPVLGIEMGTQNYPGATGNGIGYKKDHHYNSRGIFGVTDQDIWTANESMCWNLGIHAGQLSAGPDNSFVEDQFYPYQMMQLRKFRSKAYARRGNRFLHAFNERVLYLNGQNPVEIGYPLFEGGDVMGIQWLNDDQALLHRYRYNAPTDQRYLEILDLDTQAHQALNIPGGEAPYPQDSPFSDILVIEDGTAFFGRYDPEFSLLRLWTLGQDNQFSPAGQWNLPASETGTPGPGSKLVLQSGTGSMIDALLWWEYPADDTHPYPWGKLYGARIDAANTPNSDPVIPARIPTMNVWPNPSRTMINLEIKGLASEALKAEVYNIRGQKVASLSGFDRKEDGSLSSTWNGSDSSSQRLPAGVYLIRVKAGRDVKLVKRVSIY